MAVATSTALTIAAVGAGVGALGTVASIQQQRQGAKQQKKALAAQRRADEIKAAQARVKSVREASIKRGE